ncbi:hypothetical protein ENSA5_04090 [Enhygromyxa salina]|uniref:DUF2278 family protein n=1 Tax=Enhygromyxa salina TaxID=215803 RepID=A0A2S9YJQ1_9BACT|nr:YukJ family protein [Enhygromyxa salina]PRQ05290.1 hypothetical protein ENSA5_04090 [Enhygromyxa salina]
MPLERYGVLKARPIASRQGRGRAPHYHIHAIDHGEDYRVSIAVRSAPAPSQLLYLIDDRFTHPVLARLRELPMGFCGQPSRPDAAAALDYVRGQMLTRARMSALPWDVPGPDEDFNELLHLWVGRALRDEDALIYAFGERFGPQHTPDPHFGFRPSTGIYRVHMNQGSVGAHDERDGAWQDGALMLWFPPIIEQGRTKLAERWVAVFVAFASQRWDSEPEPGMLTP